jgi:hypothetical protein
MTKAQLGVGPGIAFKVILAHDDRPRVGHVLADAIMLLLA